MARIDYGQVPAIKTPKLKGCWLISSYGSLKKAKDNFDNLKWIENRYLNSPNRSVPGYALVGIKKSSEKWGIIKVWRNVK